MLPTLGVGDKNENRNIGNMILRLSWLESRRQNFYGAVHTGYFS
jgi:hypothetical protein